LGKIGDPETRWKALQYYNRYHKNDPADLEAQMVHLIDKAQGTTRRADLIFDTSRVMNEKKKYDIKFHLWQTAGNMYLPAEKLIENLSDQETKSEVKEIVVLEYERLANVGHQEIADAYSGRIRLVS
jgi:hypothetical protein